MTELLPHKHLIYIHLQHNSPSLTTADSDTAAENIHLHICRNKSAALEEAAALMLLANVLTAIFSLS